MLVFPSIKFLYCSLKYLHIVHTLYLSVFFYISLFIFFVSSYISSSLESSSSTSSKIIRCSFLTHWLSICVRQLLSLQILLLLLSWISFTSNPYPLGRVSLPKRLSVWPITRWLYIPLNRVLSTINNDTCTLY